ncbi:MAG TPA: succinate dehydrogenase, cytochrome b556 subunit [Rhodocyclaceae bacterium]|jgi:succinate dehydrogenase / fumarate reductase cytochrome b subunit|nr:succinate dehydrogenase, cytochrome b556 subunit [Rhodocyclaceae bacterium]
MAVSRSNPPVRRSRPKFLDLTAIRLPLAGFVSILHRVSGSLLFLALPALIGMFALSLESPAGFERAGQLIRQPMIGIPLFGLAWAYLHHFCAGIRFLLLDMHIGLDKEGARKSAVAVLVVSLLLTALLALKLLGVF